MLLIGIAGGSGSGKSTFANKVVAQVQSAKVIHLHQDSYYLPTLLKDYYVNGKPNFDHPNAFDWPLLRTHLRSLKEGQQIETPEYDFKKSIRKATTHSIGPTEVCIFDGIYALWDSEIREMLDLKVFLHVEADIRFIRRLHRDVRERGRDLDSIITQYYDTVRPMHRHFLESTSQYADIIVGEETDKASEVISAKIKNFLGQTS